MRDDDLVSEATCLPDEKFEAVLKVLAESGSKSTSSNKVTSKEDHLVYKLKQKADAERQLEDELFSDGDYSSIEFDSKKLKKCTSHESYKQFSGMKSSNFSSVHVDAAVKFPFFNKPVSRLSKNERSSHSENDTPCEQNLPSYCENEEHLTIVDETVTNSNLNTTMFNNKSSDYDLVPQGYEEKRFSKLQDALKNHYDEIEMVDSIDLRKKATYTTNTTDLNGCHDKRRSNSQKDDRSEYCDNLLFNEMQIGSHLRLSNYNPGLVTQKCASGNYDLSSGGFHQAYGRFSPPLDRESQTLRQRAGVNNGASRVKRNKRAADDMCNVVKSEQINGYRGTDPLDSLLQFIEGRKQVQRLSGKNTSVNEVHVNNSIIENLNNEENGTNSNCAKKKTKVKREKAKKASSIGTSCDAADVEEEIMNTRARSTLENMRFLCKSDEFQTSIGSNETSATNTRRTILPTAAAVTVTTTSVSNFKLQGTATVGGGATTSKDFSTTEFFMNNIVDRKFDETYYELQYENGREMEEASFITVTSKKQKKSDNRQKKVTLTQQQPKTFPVTVTPAKKFPPRNAVPSSITTTPLVMRHSPSAAEYLDASTSSKMNCNNDEISTDLIWPSITVGKNPNPPLKSAETASQEKTFVAAPAQRRFSCPPVEFLDKKENHAEIINMTNALGGLTFGCFDDEDESGSNTVINCNNTVHRSNSVVTNNDIKANDRIWKSTNCQTDDVNVKSEDSTDFELNDRVKSKDSSDNRLLNDMANFINEHSLREDGDASFPYYLSQVKLNMDNAASTSALSTTTPSLGTLAPRRTSALSTDVRPKRKVDVLDEDEYIGKLEKIIQRDYFPDIAKFKAQNEYFDAVRNNDQVKIKQLQERFSSRRTDKPLNTPRSPHEYFETPVGEKDSEKAWEEDLVTKIDKKEDKKMEQEDAEGIEKLTIDKFLYKFTSEDNASFEEILDESELKLREKHSWMYNAESEHDKKYQDSLHLKQADEQLLAITEGESTSSQMLKRNRKRASVDNWTYKALNAVMFTPDGVALTPEELVERHKMKQREILPRNTRLPPEILTRTASGALSTPAALRAVADKGKVDAQGNELYTNKDKYSFVVTPSPAPGVNESPLMTWGQIEGTPFRLDAADTIVAHTPGPTFRIPDIPVRDELALKMAGEATRKAKEKRNSAVNDLKKLTPKFSRARSVERMDSMSPAAKRLASTKLGIRLGTDKSLKASYTPSPARSILAKSPLVSYDTPNYQETPKERSSLVTSSLTDNLLNISTHKPKATDYF